MPARRSCPASAWGTEGRGTCRDEGVGLDQQGASVSISSGEPRGGFLQILGVLEGHDARDRDVEAEIQRDIGEFAAGGEAVDHAGKGTLPHLVAQDFGGIGLGIAGMDDDREPVSREAAICARKLARWRSRSLWS
jgi:hypothetical protein